MFDNNRSSSKHVLKALLSGYLKAAAGEGGTAVAWISNAMTPPSSMKIALICLMVAVAAVMADKPIEVLSRQEVRDDRGQYSLSYQTANGITVVEHGELKPTPDGKDHVLIKSGGYQYTSPDGTPVDIKYKADEFGYVAHGAAIPVAPTV